MRISLKFAVGSISALSVSSIAIVLVVIGYVLNSRMVERLGQEQALALGSIATANVQNSFEQPAKAVLAAMDYVQRPGTMIPSDDPNATWYENWERIIDYPFYGSNSTILVSVALLADDSSLRARVYDNKLINQMYCPNKSSTFLRQIYLSNFSDVDPQYFYPFPFGNVRASAYPVFQAAKQTLNQTRGAAFWRSFDAAAFPTEIIKIVVGVLTNNTGAFLGYMMVVTSYTQIDGFLEDAVSLIPGATAVVIDALDRVVATSMDSTYPARWFIPNITQIYNASTVGPNCVLPNPSDPQKTGACMHTVANYGFAPLAAATTLVPATAATQGLSEVFEVTVDGYGTYYVVAERLQNSISTNFTLALYLFYPKQHVLAGVRDTQNLSVILSCVIAFVVVVASAVFTSRLVIPLVHLGSQMRHTASLSDDASPVSGSFLTEVWNLEQAYVSMREQLLKIRQFLPQTIFEARKGSESNSNPLETSPSEGSGSEGVPGQTSVIDIETSGSNLLTTSLLMQPKMQIAHSLLNEELNTFFTKRVTVVVIEVFALPDTPSELSSKVKPLMNSIVQHCEKYGGVLEQVHPRLAVVTFNAHKPCVMHEERAVNFALRVAPVAAALGGVIAVDTTAHSIGSCGAHNVRARILVGEGMDVCTKLTSLQRHLLKVNVLVTERVAQALSPQLTLIPLDFVGFHWAQAGRVAELKVFSVRRLLQQSSKIAALDIHRSAFVKMMSGDRAAAVETLSKLPMPLDPATNRLRVRFSYLLEYLQIPMKRMEIPCWELKGDSLVPAENSGGDEVAGGGMAEGDENIGHIHETSPLVDASDANSSDKDAETAVRQLLQERIAGASTTAAPDAIKTEGLIDMFAVADSPHAEDDIPLEITDIRGTKWIRAKKHMTTNGANGSIFRVLGPRGILSAAKALSFATESIEGTIEMELELMSRLRHENIVTYHSCAVLEHHLILFMEFMAGGSVRDVLNEFGTIPVQLGCRYFREIVRGLQYLHEHGVVHCDLKPDNVLLTQEGVCKLSDFGSSLTGYASAADYTQLRGTGAYMAPEVAQGHSPTMASDIWSLGIVLAEILTGEHPFGASRLSEVATGNFIARLSRREVDLSVVVPKIAASQPNVPVSALEIVSSCLRYEPHERPTAIMLLSSEFCL